MNSLKFATLFLASTHGLAEAKLGASDDDSSLRGRLLSVEARAGGRPFPDDNSDTSPSEADPIDSSDETEFVAFSRGEDSWCVYYYNTVKALIRLIHIFADTSHVFFLSIVLGLLHVMVLRMSEQVPGAYNTTQHTLSSIHIQSDTLRLVLCLLN